MHRAYIHTCSVFNVFFVNMTHTHTYTHKHDPTNKCTHRPSQRYAYTKSFMLDTLACVRLIEQEYKSNNYLGTHQ